MVNSPFDLIKNPGQTIAKTVAKGIDITKKAVQAVPTKVPAKTPIKTPPPVKKPTTQPIGHLSVKVAPVKTFNFADSNIARVEELKQKKILNQAEADEYIKLTGKSVVKTPAPEVPKYGNTVLRQGAIGPSANALYSLGENVKGIIDPNQYIFKAKSENQGVEREKGLGNLANDFFNVPRSFNNAINAVTKFNPAEELAKRVSPYDYTIEQEKKLSESRKNNYGLTNRTTTISAPNGKNSATDLQNALNGFVSGSRLLGGKEPYSYNPIAEEAGQTVGQSTTPLDLIMGAKYFGKVKSLFGDAAGAVAEKALYKTKYIDPEELKLAISQLTSGVKRDVSTEALTAAKNLISNAKKGESFLGKIKQGADVKVKRDFLGWLDGMFKKVPRENLQPEVTGLLDAIKASQKSPVKIESTVKQAMSVFSERNGSVSHVIPSFNNLGKFAQLKGGKKGVPGIDFAAPLPQQNIPKELQPLIEEARKYKSAGEFIKAQGEPLYHRTDKVFDNFDLNKKQPTSSGIHFDSSKARSDSKSYIERFGRNQIEAYTNTKLADITANVTPSDEISYAHLPKDLQEAVSLRGDARVDKLKKLGYGGYRSGTEVVIFNPKDIVTTTQLANIWTKANTTSPEPTYTIPPEPSRFSVQKQTPQELVMPGVDVAPKVSGNMSAPEVQGLERKIINLYKDAGKHEQYPDAYKVDEHLANIYQELDGSEAGKRFQIGNGEVIGIPSTFPKWIPEGLRSKELFSKVLGGLQSVDSIKFPPKNSPKQRALYDILLNEVDKRSGVDTKSIREQITNFYDGQKETRRIEESVNRSLTGGERPTREPKLASEVTEEEYNQMTPEEQAAFLERYRLEAIAKEETLATPEELVKQADEKGFKEGLPFKEANQTPPQRRRSQLSGKALSVPSNNISKTKLSERDKNLKTIIDRTTKKMVEEKLALQENEMRRIKVYEEKLAEMKSQPKTSFYQQYKETMDPFKYQGKSVADAWTKRIRKIAVANEKANIEYLKLADIPKKDGLDTILRYQEGLETKYSNRLRDVFDSLFRDSNSRGIEVGYTKNYIPQVYANDTGEIMEAMAKFMEDKGIHQDVIKEYLEEGTELPVEISNALKLSPSFTKEKAFPNYKTAMQYGLTPRYAHPAQLAAHYRSELEKSLANREFIEELMESHSLVNEKLEGYKPVDVPFSDEQLYAAPKFARALNNYFRDEENLGLGARIAKTTAKVSKFMQEVILSGGIPSTNINFFSIGQTIKNLTAGEAKVLGRFVASNSDAYTKGWFRANQPYISKMAEEGISVAGRTGNWDTAFRQLSSKKGLGRIVEKAGDVFGDLFNKKTFQSYLPMQTVSIFKNAFDSAIGKGMSELEARKLAGETTKAWEGIIEDWGRSKTTQDTINALLFAPRFREGMLTLYTNTAKSLSWSKLSNPAFAKNRKFLIGAAITFVLYNLLNKKLNGNYMWQNEAGKEFDLKIPVGGGKYLYLAFLPSILSFPRNMASGAIALSKLDVKTAGQKFGSLFSMPIKLISEIASNKDYFGQSIWEEDATRIDKMKSIGNYLAINYNHPFVGVLYGKLFTEKGKQKDWYEILSKVTEMPFKFNTQDNISKGKFYDAMDKEQQSRNDELEPIQELYNRLQTMKAEGKKEEADKIYFALSSKEKKLYKDVKEKEKTKATKELQIKLYPLYTRLQTMKSEGKKEEADKIYFALSDDEKAAYKLLKGKFKSGDVSLENLDDYRKKASEAKDEKGVLDTVLTYSEAIGTDPATAFDRIFAGEKIRRTDNGTIIVERMSLEESTKVKKEGGGNNPGMKLDHTIPLELGGTNDPGNLKLVPTAEWKSYSPVENYLGKLLRDGDISGSKAKELIVKFKMGKISFEQIKSGNF